MFNFFTVRNASKSNEKIVKSVKSREIVINNTLLKAPKQPQYINKVIINSKQLNICIYQ